MGNNTGDRFVVNDKTKKKSEKLYKLQKESDETKKKDSIHQKKEQKSDNNLDKHNTNEEQVETSKNDLPFVTDSKSSNMTLINQLNHHPKNQQDSSSQSSNSLCKTFMKLNRDKKEEDQVRSQKRLNQQQPEPGHQQDSSSEPNIGFDKTPKLDQKPNKKVHQLLTDPASRMTLIHQHQKLDGPEKHDWIGSRKSGRKMHKLTETLGGPLFEFNNCHQLGNHSSQFYNISIDQEKLETSIERSTNKDEPRVETRFIQQDLLSTSDDGFCGATIHLDHKYEDENQFILQGESNNGCSGTSKQLEHGCKNEDQVEKRFIQRVCEPGHQKVLLSQSDNGFCGMINELDHDCKNQDQMEKRFIDEVSEPGHEQDLSSQSDNGFCRMINKLDRDYKNEDQVEVRSEPDLSSQSDNGFYRMIDKLDQDYEKEDQVETRFNQRLAEPGDQQDFSSRSNNGFSRSTGKFDRDYVEEDQVETSKRVLQLVTESMFSMMQVNGQRKLGGPPPGWKGPPPGPGCEVFVGKIPRTLYEHEIYPVFREMGEVYEIRLMMDFSGTNRGYCFVMFGKPEFAQRAIRELDNREIRPGRRIGVVASINNCRLYVGQLPHGILSVTVIKVG